MPRSNEVWVFELLISRESGQERYLPSKQMSYTRALRELVRFEKMGYRGRLVEVARPEDPDPTVLT